MCGDEVNNLAEKSREEQIRAIEEAIADKNNPKWAELGRIMAEDIRKEMLLRYHTLGKTFLQGVK